MGTNNKVFKGYVRSVILLFTCILLNYIGSRISSALSLPGCFDSYGTFLSAYLMGPVPGAIIGAASNMIFALWEPLTLAYAVVNIFIGIGVGIMAKKRCFDTLFHSMTVAGTITVGCVVLSSIINIELNNGSTGNMWGDGVKDLLIENGLNKYLAAVVGEFYIDFPDKLITVLTMYLTIKVYRKLKNSDSKNVQKTISALSAAVIMTSVLSAVPVRTCADEEEPQQEVKERAHIAFVQSVFGSDTGLSCGHANDIVQTGDGILWIGTYAGLFRYSGSEFRHMSDFPEIRNVNCLYADNEGRLWVGTNDNGVVVVINDRVANVLNTASGMPSDSIRSIVQNASGEYYIGTSDGIVTIDLKMGMMISGGLPQVGYTGRLSADSEGNTAAVNSEGILYILNEGKIVCKADSKNGEIKYTSCYFASDETLFAGTDSGYVYEFRLEGNKLTEERVTECTGMAKINDIIRDEGGIVWLCADNGIGYMNAKREFVRHETGDFTYSIEHMQTDYQGNIWFASSRQGLLRLSRSRITDIFTDTGIEPTVVNTTALYNGLLYTGTDEGLIIIDTAKHIRVESSVTERMEGSRIRCLTPDSRGRLWICSYGAGLFSVDDKDYTVAYSEKIPEIGARVRVCTELHDGTIAASSSNGLFFLKNGRLTASIPLGEELGYAQTLCMLETDDGTLYAGTDGNGIIMLKDHSITGRISKEDGLTSEVILRMAQDPADGSIYVVTSNSICLLKDGKVRELSGFPYSNNYEVILDDDGEVFVPGSSGVYIVNKQQLLDDSCRDTVLLDTTAGLTGSITANSWNAVDGSKNIYLSSDRGVYLLNLDSYKPKRKTFRLMVSQIKVDDVRHKPERDSILNVERNSSKLEFIPEVINYTHEDPVISYYLEGFENDWIRYSQSELASISYTNLAPGDYTFHLAIRDDSGKVLEESVYKIHKEKAIYDNFWFRYYMIGVAVIFVGWLTWFITRRQLERTLEIQQTKLSLALKQVKMGNETILAIAKTVDAKDVRTSKHSQRVSEYSAMIAKEYGFSEAEQENIRKAALLHDIGKIGIPDSVLNKPGRLTDEEYALMKTHVTRGAEILKDFTLIDHVVEGARYHHERYDGKGYPEGLSGKDIPLYGRIIAVADTFDAMTANRIYRKRQDFDYVMSELHKGRGTQFDPELLDIFLKLIEDKKIDIDALYAENPDKEECEHDG
ncbi:MAG: HD domain-containing protein [Ruminococcus sp.]|nr:HD domain-containing protein [Ruminococcus sp.]